jgi:hypothetical protein
MKIKHIYLASIILLSQLISCQEDTADMPPLNTPDGVLTVAELRDMYTGQTVRFTQNTMVYATVSMDEVSGNIYRNIFVEDGTGGINVRMDFATDVREGDSIRLALKGTILSSYNNMLQLDSVVFGKNLVFQTKADGVEPHTTSIPDILAGGLQARLIRLEHVQFASGELGHSFANVTDGISENRTITDCSNNRIIVRTSPYADFANNHGSRRQRQSDSRSITIWHHMAIAHPSVSMNCTWTESAATPVTLRDREHLTTRTMWPMELPTTQVLVSGWRAILLV